MTVKEPSGRAMAAALPQTGMDSFRRPFAAVGWPTASKTCQASVLRAGDPDAALFLAVVARVVKVRADVAALARTVLAFNTAAQAEDGGDGTSTSARVGGALLTFAPRPLYAVHAPDVTLPWGYTPLEDQQLGGLLMWVPGGLLFVLVLALGLALALRPGARAAS